MVDFERPVSHLSSLYGSLTSEDDSMYPSSSLSYRSDCDQSSDITSVYAPASSELSDLLDRGISGKAVFNNYTGVGHTLMSGDNIGTSQIPDLRISDPFHRNVRIPSPVESNLFQGYDNRSNDEGTEVKSGAFQTLFPEVNNTYNLNGSLSEISDSFTMYESSPHADLENGCASNHRDSQTPSPRFSEMLQVDGNGMSVNSSADSNNSVHSLTPPSKDLNTGHSSKALSVVSRGSCKSNMSSPRPSRGDAETLYRSPITCFNPSGHGEHVYQECMDLTSWANKCLSEGTVRIQINDLAKELGDGLTLLDLVEVLTGGPPPQIHIKPGLQVQKMENIQACLDFLEESGVPMDGISAEDLVKGNMKVVLALCHCLRRVFGTPAGSLVSSDVTYRYQPMSLTDDRSKDRHMNQSTNIATPYCGGTSGLVECGTQARLFTPTLTGLPSRETAELCSVAGQPNKDSLCKKRSMRATGSGRPVAVDRDDVLLLQWVSKVTGQVVSGYHDFQDGDLLCRLVNRLASGGVPDLVIQAGSPSEKVDFALQVCREELGLNSDLQPVNVIASPDTFKLSLFLNQLRKLFTQHCEVEMFQNTASEMKKGLKGKLNSGVKEQWSVGKQLADSSDYQRQRRREAELRSEIDSYEKKKLDLEEKLQHFQTEYSEFDARKLDVNGNYIDNSRERSPVWGSSCDYLNETSVGTAKDYGYHSLFKPNGASYQSNRVAVLPDDKWRVSRTVQRETELPMSQLRIGASPKIIYNLLEETSVFGPSDKWRTPSSYELQSGNFMAEKFSGRDKAKQRLTEIKRHLELLKLMYLCQTERDGTSAQTKTGNMLSQTTRDLGNSNFLSRGFRHSQPSSHTVQNTVAGSNNLKTVSDMALTGRTRATPDTKSSLSSGDILNMTYPPVSMRARPRSADSLSHRRPHSAGLRPKSASSSISYASSSTSYRKSPDVLNIINTRSKSNADFPVAGYIEASGSQLFLPRSRPLGINDPISARTKTKVLTKGKFSTSRTACTGTSANIVRTTEKVISEPIHTPKHTTECDLDVVSHLDDESTADSVSAEEHGAIVLPGSRPSSRADSEDKRTDSTVDESECSSRPPKLHGLTALIRMTAKKASG